MKIAVSGAGLVGSLWAVLLRQQGYQVDVFERRPDPRQAAADAGRSINLVITSRGLHGLDRAELRGRLKDSVVPVFGRMMHAKSGETAYQAYGQSGECNFSVSRAHLNRFLIDEAESAGAAVHFEHKVEGFDHKTKRLAGSSPAGRFHFDYDVLFGTDGAGSAVRKQLLQSFPEKFHEDLDWLEADYKELTLPVGKDGKPRLRQDALHIWPRGSHMMMALANHEGSFTVTLYLPKTGAEISFEKIKSDAQVQALFASEFADAVPLMPDYVAEFKGHPQGALGTVRTSKWVLDGSVALMGDAAHGITPFFGQGMNCGFEDCTTLLRHLQEAGGDWRRALSAYESEQKPNADAIADMALENWTEMRDKVGDKQFLCRKKVDAMLEERHPSIYKSRYGMITYTLVPYLLAKRAGEIQGRILDRLTGGVDSPEGVDWDEAERLLSAEWIPFKERHKLDLRRYT
jgi:kynurenine 3-monooxygenase